MLPASGKRAFCAVVVLLGCAHEDATKARSGQSAPAPELAREVASLLEQQHYRHPKAEALLAHVQADSPPDAAVAAVLDALADRATRRLSTHEVQKLLSDATGAADSSGVGLTELLSVDIAEATGLATVVTAIPGSPAMRAGLRPGDSLTRIAGTPTEGLNLSGVMKLLRGAPDPVVLSVTRADAVREVTLRREASAGAAERKPWSVMLPRGVGYLRLEAFYPGDGPALREALRTLVAAKATRLVLDLRDNPGGDGATALDVVGALAGELDCGTGLKGVGPKLFDGAIAVLVDEGSASAAELVSGALQAAGRAKLFGTRTFGKGLLHADLPLSDGSTLLVSLGRLVTTKGRDILSEGLEPDVRVATPENPVSREVAPPVSAIIADPQVAAAL